MSLLFSLYHRRVVMFYYYFTLKKDIKKAHTKKNAFRSGKTKNYFFLGRTFFFLSHTPTLKLWESLDIRWPQLSLDTFGRRTPTHSLFLLLLARTLPPALEQEFPARLLLLRKGNFRPRGVDRQDFDLLGPFGPVLGWHPVFM